MHRVQVQFSDEQVHALQAEAASTGRPVTAVVREAVAAWMADRERRRRVDRALAAIGGSHSGLLEASATFRSLLEEGAELVTHDGVIEESDLEPLLEDELLPVPESWQTMPDGRPVPNAVRAIRLARRSR